MRIGRTRFISAEQAVREAKCGARIWRVVSVLAAALSIAAVFNTEQSRRDYQVAFDEVQKLSVNAREDSLPDRLHGRVVHLVAENVHPDEILRDEEFGVIFPQSYRVRRTVEYCQWLEHSFDHVERDRDGNERRSRTYSYTKTWVPRPVPSFLYDQPFAHHNPQRTPYEDQTSLVRSATAGLFRLSSEILKALPLNTRSKFRPTDVSTETSAFNNHGFVYIGDGYFLSKYQPSLGESVVRTAGQIAEGSLLDFQIADLFSRCDAGDVRVYFDVCIGSVASVVGQLSDSSNEIGAFTASNGVAVGLMHFGKLSLDEMTRQYQSSHFWNSVFVARVCAALFIGSATYVHCPLNYQWQPLSASFVLLVFGSVWALVWGFSIVGMLSAVIGAALFQFSRTMK
eukprot:ANDGO_02615.mRNA.1 Transmembrane protein 43 homolog